MTNLNDPNSSLFDGTEMNIFLKIVRLGKVVLKQEKYGENRIFCNVWPCSAFFQS